MTTAVLPERQAHWELAGAGLDRLSMRQVALPKIEPGQLLVRIDACGMCFSDIKILNLGGAHPRLQGRDLESEPVIMGHETAMTVMDVGSELRDRFAPGERYLIQADVYYNGRGTAFGYRLPGGYSQYQVIGREILDGDEGCYLLPVPPRLSHAQAALCEPWACVEAAYRFNPRREDLPAGERLVVDLNGRASSEPGLRLTPDEHPWLLVDGETEAGVEALCEDQDGGFDDIFVIGTPSPRLVESLARRLRQDGLFRIRCAGGIGSTEIDIGAVHYRGHWYTGSADGSELAWNRTAELIPGGAAWFIGAGGPLGQMHLQRALSLPKPPAHIIASQRGGPRLEDLRSRFEGLAGRRGVRLTLLDSQVLGEEIYGHVREITGGRGCDDICVIVPNAGVVEKAWETLAPGGGLDVFAGVPVGTLASLDLTRLVRDGARLWGTSGSSIADLRRIVEKAGSGEIATDRVVAAVGGIEAVHQGLQAVSEGLFPGKTVIYPHCRDLPLSPITDLAGRHPSLAACLEDGRYWTPEAEAELFRLYGAG